MCGSGSLVRYGPGSVVRGAEAQVVKIKIDLSGPQQSKWYEYLIRFAFGGVVTALTGIIAQRCGPEIGGLFLAFPAIFPATATLLEKHERKKKEKYGRAGRIRAREVVGVDAAGAAMGSVGLLAFAAIVWRWLPRYPIAVVLCAATVAWAAGALLTWEAHDVIGRRARAKLVRRII